MLQILDYSVDTASLSKILP